MNASERTFTIGQLAEKTGLTRRALRLYEQVGLLVPQRATNGYRHYTEQQLKEASVIRDLREAGLSLPVIGRLIAIKRTDGSAQQKLSGCLEVLDQMHSELIAKRQAVDAALQQLEIYQQEAVAALNALAEPEKRTF